jgi:hypothetical protein
MTYTEDLRGRCGDALSEALDAAAAAAAAGDWRQVAAAAGRLEEWAGHTCTAVVRDALAAGVGWWALGELLGLHPQAAWESCRAVTEGLSSPAEQRPGLAVVCTAGLVSSHDFDDEYGIDADDLGADHSLAAEPTVAPAARGRCRARRGSVDRGAAAGRLRRRRRRPDTDVAITRWTTVVLHPDELGWLREALAFNATDDEEDELEPL